MASCSKVSRQKTSMPCRAENMVTCSTFEMAALFTGNMVTRFAVTMVICSHGILFAFLPFCLFACFLLTMSSCNYFYLQIFFHMLLSPCGHDAISKDLPGDMSPCLHIFRYPVNRNRVLSFCSRPAT